MLSNAAAAALWLAIAGLIVAEAIASKQGAWTACSRELHAEVATFKQGACAACARRCLRDLQAACLF